MSSFRKPMTLLRESAGGYIDGQWVAGTRTAMTVQASAQPIAAGQDMQAMPEGRRLSDAAKFYCADRLQVTDDGLQPDIIVHEGAGYELVSVFANQSNVISHYKYIGVKSLKFTSVADWLSGATGRE